MWIIFGASEFQRDHGAADRFCLRCRKVTIHSLCSAKAWLTLFFVPVLPLGWREFHVRCGLCGHTLPEVSRRQPPRWTLPQRRKDARFWGWVFTVASAAWTSLLLLGSVVSWLARDPNRPEVPVDGLLFGLVFTALPPLALGLLFFRKAARVQRLLDVPEAGEESESSDRPQMVKKCPRCAGEIALEALACRHCGQEFDAAQVSAARQKAEAQLNTYVRRLERQARVAELTRKRTWFLLIGWLTLCTCVLSWLAPFLLWEAHRLKQEIRALETRPV